MLKKRKFPAFYFAPVAVHGKMELWIVMFHRNKKLLHLNIGIQLFLDLSDLVLVYK